MHGCLCVRASGCMQRKFIIFIENEWTSERNTVRWNDISYKVQNNNRQYRTKTMSSNMNMVIHSISVPLLPTHTHFCQTIKGCVSNVMFSVEIFAQIKHGYVQWKLKEKQNGIKVKKNRKIVQDRIEMENCSVCRV